MVSVVTGIDLTNESQVERYYADLPPIWASIHIAGGFCMGSIDRTSASAFRKMMDLNALSCFLCCREAVKKMRAHAGESDGPGVGRIVNVAARPALEPRTGAGMAAYAASKAAVAAMTEALAEEVVDQGILVNAVAPSILDTPANRRAMPDADHAKWASVEAVAGTMAFLASPGNLVTRGGVVPVYGES